MIAFELLKRISRKTLVIRNKLFDTDKTEIKDLVDLLDKPPRVRNEIDAWTTNTQKLIESLVLNRISREDMATILAGIVSYQKTGITPAATQNALVRAYENSSGLFQEILNKTLFKNTPSEPKKIDSTLFGPVGEDIVEQTLNEIMESGYSVFPLKLDAEIIEQLRTESQVFEYQLKGGDLTAKEVSGINVKQPPTCISAYAKSGCIAKNELLQKICQDELFLQLSSAYIGAPSTAIDSTLWYTFPADKPSSDTAQLFHYDLDTIKWIKVFIYITDVDENTGPHEYVRGSHKPQNKDPEVLVRNYSRIEDDEIEKSYPGMRRAITGSSGTVIFGDTRCFHKGNSVKKGYRLIYSPIYAPSKLGYYQG